jgi:hypothetical protein
MGEALPYHMAQDLDILEARSTRLDGLEPLAEVPAGDRGGQHR